MNDEPHARRLLIIDDDPELREALGMALEITGYTVALVETAEEGLTWLGRHDFPHAVITDANLPGISGERFVQKVRQNGWAVTVIGISTAERAEQMIQAGATSFLPKPVEMPALLKILES